MQPALNILAEWERLHEGAPEERACFAALSIQCNSHWLTEGLDEFVNRVRHAPLLSAYHLAEWLAWNWWRLRWEPRADAPEWALAHRMATIGNGYVWPNITIFSDGERTALIAKPIEQRRATPFRYISDYAAVVPSQVFENTVDRFLGQVLGQLQAEGITGTNLNQIWSELAEERQNPDAAKRRKLEALLSQDPDNADASVIANLLADAEKLGNGAVEELAAAHSIDRHVFTADELEHIAIKSGFTASPRDAASLDPLTLPRRRDIPAWKLGADAARALREQAGLGASPIQNKVLASLAGVEAHALTGRPAINQQLSFALEENATRSRIVLRSRGAAGRRFELARLLADQIVATSHDKLRAATRTYTYRQKMQRSFAAELLSPFEAVDEMLNGDYSAEAQQDAAEHFQVSDRTILTLLVNHHRLEREELDEDFGAAA